MNDDSANLNTGARLVLLVGLILVSATVFGQNSLPVRLTVKESALGDAVVPYFVSPDSRRVAHRDITAGGRERMVLDGAAQPEYDRIVLTKAPVFSPDGSRMAYVAEKGGQVLVLDGQESAPHTSIGSVVFSKNSRRVAYVVGDNGKYGVVCDGIPSSAYDAVGKPVFSPDGSRVAFIAKKADQVILVADGRESPPSDKIPVFSFSDDNRRLAYVAVKGDRCRVVVDGQAGEEMEQLNSDPVFSPGGKREAHTGKIGGQFFAVVDGVKLGPYSGIGEPFFSPNGSKVAFIIKGADNLHRVMTDGREGASYRGVGQPLVFSADGSRLAFVAVREDGKWVVVVDSQEHDGLQGVGKVLLSPDGRRSMYSRAQNNRWQVVVDGQPSPEYDALFDMFFSPDGKRTAWVARRAGKYIVVTDGIESPAYSQLGNATTAFSPDGKHLAYVAGEPGAHRVFVDNAASPEFIGTLTGSTLVWDSADSLHVLILRPPKIHRMEIKVEHP